MNAVCVRCTVHVQKLGNFSIELDEIPFVAMVADAIEMDGTIMVIATLSDLFQKE